MNTLVTAASLWVLFFTAQNAENPDQYGKVMVTGLQSYESCVDLGNKFLLSWTQDPRIEGYFECKAQTTIK